MHSLRYRGRLSLAVHPPFACPPLHRILSRHIARLRRKALCAFPDLRFPEQCHRAESASGSYRRHNTFTTTNTIR